MNCKSACRREEKNTGCVIVSLALLTMQHIINFHFCCERLGETGRQAGSQVNTKHILHPNNTMDWRGPVLDDLDNFPCVRDQRVERYRDYCVVCSYSAMICTSDIRFYLLHLHQYWAMPAWISITLWSSQLSAFTALAQCKVWLWPLLYICLSLVFKKAETEYVDLVLHPCMIIRRFWC